MNNKIEYELILHSMKIKVKKSLRNVSLYLSTSSYCVIWLFKSTKALCACANGQRNKGGQEDKTGESTFLWTLKNFRIFPFMKM